tara:strand:+ start:894 stop:1247 length:354 start_codon:yes stop_codon:yes gene_type:complete
MKYSIIKHALKMKILFRNLILLILATIFLNSCQNAKNAIAGKKKSNSDEFLVIKKKPLVLPPEFSKLPIPESINQKSIKEDSIEIILKKGSDINNKNTDDKKISSSLEKLIMKKIKK